MISAVILTKNEEKNILDCLESVSWVDEIVIIDDFSQDRTLEVANNFGNRRKVKIYRNDLKQNFAAQRNYALSKTTKEWVLFVDADERISKELKEEINTLLIEEKKKQTHSGFFIQRKDVMWGKMLKHGETGSIKLLRLGRKIAGIWQGKVHEQWVFEGSIGELDNYLIHYPHPKINEFLNEINFYTTIRAEELYEKGVKTSVLEILIYPKAKFFINFIFKLGFLDGLEGFLFAMLMSLHSFMVRGKLWQLWQKN